MSATSDKRSQEFLKIAEQFKLGALVTESSHPVTVNLSEVAKQDIPKALDLLFQVDSDVVAKYREFAESGRAGQITETLVRALKNGGRIFFTGCGSTGRLSIQLVSIWRDFWQRAVAAVYDRRRDGVHRAPLQDWEHRAFSVMAGGDYALIKSVEGFEDFADFGKKQLGDLGVCCKDVVFAITEGGETSFVIGTAWKGLEAGAKVYFVYNNPDEILCQHVERSRKVIEDSRIEKINLTTGSMAITGSTRMQATTIQLCVMLTVLEMVVQEAVQNAVPEESRNPAAVPRQILHGLTQLLLNLRAPNVLTQVASLVALEESVYRAGRKNNYFADCFGIDVLTDTTERSPTYCTPPFRKFNDSTATESWSFLFTPCAETPEAWKRILRRGPHCVEWNETEVRALVGENFARTSETIRKISRHELMRFRIGMDGLEFRRLADGDSAIAVMSSGESKLLAQDGFIAHRFAEARAAGAKTGLLCFGGPFQDVRDFLSRTAPDCVTAFVPVLPDRSCLGITKRVAVKLVLNALSTCTMVRLGRVMGNYMVWVVPSNLKLIDRATRYIEKLAGLNYEQANRLLFEVIEYVEPRMKSDRAYPPVVGVAVLRARYGLTNEEAEKQILNEMH